MQIIRIGSGLRSDIPLSLYALQARQAVYICMKIDNQLIPPLYQVQLWKHFPRSDRQYSKLTSSVVIVLFTFVQRPIDNYPIAPVFTSGDI